MLWIYNLKTMLNERQGRTYVVPKLEEDQPFTEIINGEVHEYEEHVTWDEGYDEWLPGEDLDDDTPFGT